MKSPLNKSDFVRKMAPNAPAKEVVAAAKKKGIKLTERYVYVIRSSDKAKARKRGEFPARGLRKIRGGADETTLRTAIAELGLARSREIFAEVQRAVGA